MSHEPWLSTDPISYQIAHVLQDYTDYTDNRSAFCVLRSAFGVRQITPAEEFPGNQSAQVPSQHCIWGKGGGGLEGAVTVKECGRKLGILVICLKAKQNFLISQICKPK